MLILFDSFDTDRQREQENPYEYARAYDKKREDIIAEANATMGIDFNRGYLYQLHELQMLLELRQRKLFKLSTRGPEELIPYFQVLVDETLNQINNLDYAQTPEEVDYSKAYRVKLDTFLIDYNQKHPGAVVNFDDLYMRT